MPARAGLLSLPDAMEFWFVRSLATTVRMARSKISSTPSISLLLHSMYCAPIFLATAKPLLRCDGCQALRLEHVDARLLVAQV